MRPSTLARGGALLTAAALALSLGSAATASETQTERARAVEATTPAPRSGSGTPDFGTQLRRSGTGIAAVSDLTYLKAYSTVLFQPGGSWIDVDIDGEGETPAKIEVRLRVDSKASPDFFEVLDGEYGPYIEIPNSVGYGAARLFESRLTFADDSTIIDPTDSNKFYVRRYTDSEAEYPFVVTRTSSKKIKFKVDGVMIFDPKKETYRALKSIKLQYKSGSKWKTKKTIKLNSAGDGSYSWSTKTKRSYRIAYGTTSTVQGFYTEPTGKI